MPQEFSVSAIVFRKNHIMKYLLIYRKPSENFKENWDFPRGNVEQGENEIETATREAKEETGLKDLSIIDGFREKINYFYRKDNNTIYKEVIFLLIETEQQEQEVKLSAEHDDYKWLNFYETLNLLTHKKSKEILKKADEFLKTHL